MVQHYQFESDIYQEQVWKVTNVIRTIDGNMDLCLCSWLYAHCFEQNQLILFAEAPWIHTSYQPSLTVTTEVYQYSPIHTQPPTEFCQVDEPKLHSCMFGCPHLSIGQSRDHETSSARHTWANTVRASATQDGRINALRENHSWADRGIRHSLWRSSDPQSHHAVTISAANGDPARTYEAGG